MKIGIGVTTYKRERNYSLFLSQIKKYLPENAEIYTACDGQPERKGIAYRKNECIRALKDCDYMFLFDDDCFPIKKGWADYFIKSSNESGQHHFMYLKETPTIKKLGTLTPSPYVSADITIPVYEYNNCAGCMMFFTKEVIEKVGGYGTYPSPYGYEHAGYSQRIHKAGLTPLGAYTCPMGIRDFIYSMDYEFHLPFNKQVKHEPSMKDELHKVESYIRQNEDAYMIDVNTIYQPL